MLFVFVVFFALCTTGWTLPLPDFYSYSPAVGDGYGTEISTAHDERLTGIRVWEGSYYGQYISGIQLRYGTNWTEQVGSEYYTVNYSNRQEMTLLDGEYIVQVSGKFSSYITELMFVNNHGRSMKVGQPYGTSFNFYPTHDGSELRFLSGRYNGYALGSIGAHWAVYYPPTSP